MTDQLFRQEAIEYRRQKLFGDIVLATPLPSKVLGSLIGAIVFSAISVMCLASYARRETLQGWLTPDTGLARIVPPEAGVVGDLFVTEGLSVAAGDPLFTVNLAADVGSGATTATRVLGQLAVEQHDVELQLAAINQDSQVRQTEAAGRVASLRMEEEQIGRQEKLQEDRTAAAEAQLKQMSELAEKGFVPKSEFHQHQDELWSRRQETEELRRRQLDVRNQLSSLRQEAKTLPMQLTQSTSVIQQRLTDLETRRAFAERDRQITIRAPVAGSITTITARLGKYVSAAREEMVILPNGGKLQAVLYAPTKAAGFLQKGQEVRLQFDAFPFQKYGSGLGRVIDVSHTVLPAADAEIPLPDASPVYRVTVSIPDASFHSLNQAFPLQAGMTLKADAVLERRKLWEYLFEPVIAALRR